MGPSSKQWTDMFKKKYCNIGPDSNNLGSKSDALSSVLDDESEGRTQEPKVRWNPRSEQIQILKNIFDSGMVKPSREEISKIRAQLQAYGQVQDTNVFYWFQNRRSRSKLKNRRQNSAPRSATSHRPLLAPSSSSPSSGRSSSNGVWSGGILELPKISSSGLVNQNYNISKTENDQYVNLQQNQVQLQAPPPYYNQNHQIGAIATGVFGSGQAPGVRSNEIMGGGSSAAGSTSQMESVSKMLLGNQMMDGDSFITVAGGGRRISAFEDEIHQPLSQMIINPKAATQTINALPPASSYQIPPTSQVQGGAGMVAPPRSTITVYINGVEYEVSGLHPFPVQEAFGENAVLFYQSRNPVPTNNWGVTLHPLSHGASYFVERFPPPPHLTSSPSTKRCRVHAYESPIDEEEAKRQCRQCDARGYGRI